MERNISELNWRKKLGICKKLDIKEKIGGDFRDLAGYLGMPDDDLRMVCQKSRPTERVLQWAATSIENTIGRLYEVLEKMDRPDCVSILLCQGEPGEKANIPFIQRGISALDHTTRQRICGKLNVRMTFGEDFRCLAENFEMPIDAINLVSQSPNSTESVLRWAARRSENTIGKLYGVLKRMGRDDCADILDHACK